jgi:hypothetical protein
MKKSNNVCVIFTLALGLLITAASSSARAGDISVTQGMSAGGNDLFEFTLDTTGMVGGFDTVELVLTSTAGLFNQIGTPAAAVSQPSEDSGFSEFLTAPSNFGGQGLSAFGVDAANDTDSLVSGTHASLGSNDASTQGDYLLAQIVMLQGNTNGGEYVATFFDDGITVGTANGAFSSGAVIPEPSTLVMAGLSLMGVFASRRRNS